MYICTYPFLGLRTFRFQWKVHEVLVSAIDLIDVDNVASLHLDPTRAKGVRAGLESLSRHEHHALMVQTCLPNSRAL